MARLGEKLRPSLRAHLPETGAAAVLTLDYTVDGHRVVVPQDAKAYVIDGDTYRNPWLGLSVTKPKAFHFSKVDAVWPDLSVVRMEGPEHAVIEIESHSASLPTASTDAILDGVGIAGARTATEVQCRPATMISSADKAVIAVVNGGNIWVVKAAGAQPTELLRKVTATMNFGVSLSPSEHGF